MLALNNVVGELTDQFGYQLLHKLHPNSPGYGELVITIRRKPTREHFDPEVVHLIFKDGHNPCARDISWGTTYTEGSLCMGLIQAVDRIGKHLSFYSFGGLVKIVQHEDSLVVTITSPAPILNLNDSGICVARQIADCAEAIVHQLKPNWRQSGGGIDDVGFYKRLLALDPLTAYRAVLTSAYKYAVCHQTAAGQYPVTCRVILREICFMIQNNLWPASADKVAILLSSSDLKDKIQHLIKEQQEAEYGFTTLGQLLQSQ